MKNSLIKSSKIIPSSKLKGRETFLKIFEPTNLFDARFGSLYFVIEIVADFGLQSEVLKIICDQTVEEYYKEEFGTKPNDIKSLETKFERAVKSVNEKLSEIARQGKTEWIGNLNAIIALSKDDMLIITNSGNTEAYLFRKNKISHITENGGLPRKEEPSKTFSAVTSGYLESGDSLIFANSDLFDHISLDTLRQELSSASLFGATYSIVESLKSEKVNSVAAIFLRNFKETNVEEVKEDLPDTYYLDSSDVNLPKKAKMVAGSLGKSFKYGIKPGIRRAAISVGFTTVNLYESISKRIKKRNDSTSFGKNHLASSSIEIEAGRKKSNGFLQALKSVFSKKWIYILLSLLIIFGIVYFVWWQRKKIANPASFQKPIEILASVEEKIESAKTKAALHKTEEAKTEFTEAREMLNSISNKSEVQSEIDSLYNKIETEFDKLTKTKRLKNAAWSLNLLDLEEGIEANSLGYLTSAIYIPNKTGNIYKITIKNKQLKIVSNLPEESGAPALAIPLIDDSEVIVCTENKKVFRFEESTTDVAELKTTDGIFKNASALSSYFENIYFLDSPANAVWKYALAGSTFSKATNIISQNVSLAGARDLAIDGHIYILFENGTVQKLLSGSPISGFQISGIPTPDPAIKNPIKIYTLPDFNSIYVLDADSKRVIEFDKSGEFIRQIALPSEMDDFRDMIINEKLKKLYILYGTTVSEFNI